MITKFFGCRLGNIGLRSIIKKPKQKKSWNEKREVVIIVSIRLLNKKKSIVLG